MEAVHVRMINLYYPIFTYHYLSRMVITHSDVKQPENTIYIYICVYVYYIWVGENPILQNFGLDILFFSSLNSIP